MKLDQMLMSMGRYSTALHSLSEWADQILPMISHISEVYGELDTVELASEQHKVSSILMIAISIFC